MNEHGEDAIAVEEDGVRKVIEGEWGYACVKDDAVFIPALLATQDWPMRRVLAQLHADTGQTRFIFSAVLNADVFKSHLRHVVREWDEYVPEFGEHSHCIEITYEPPVATNAVEPSAQRQERTERA